MKYFVKTFGCQMNISDSERIAGFLESLGLKPAKDTKKAALVVFNTCGVRQTAEDRAYGQIHNLRKAHPKIKIILTGCLAGRKDVQRKLAGKVDAFLEIRNIEKIFEKLTGKFKAQSSKLKTETKNSKVLIQNTKYKIQDTAHKDSSYLAITPKYTTVRQAFVPIMSGCNNFCFYCVVPYARGREVSRPAEEIFSEISVLAKKGCQEITLLGQNVNSYCYKVKSQSSKVKTATKKSKVLIPITNYQLLVTGHSLINFPVLLNCLAQSFPKITFKFLTSHPKDFSEDLMRVIAQNPNISREIHLPIQSGSDKILKLMNRPYTQKHYLGLIGKAKKIIPGVSFTTDIIVGFPGETEKDFQKTMEVFKKVKFNLAYINKYSPRPGTAALSLGDPISWEEKKRREKELRAAL